jgi:hypothetical protein
LCSITIGYYSMALDSGTPHIMYAGPHYMFQIAFPGHHRVAPGSTALGRARITIRILGTRFGHHRDSRPLRAQVVGRYLEDRVQGAVARLVLAHGRIVPARPDMTVRNCLLLPFSLWGSAGRARLPTLVMNLVLPPGSSGTSRR